MTTTVLPIFGALGGLVAFCGAVTVVVRAVIRQSLVVHENTIAVQKLTAAVDALDKRMSNHGERIARLEGR